MEGMDAEEEGWQTFGKWSLACVARDVRRLTEVYRGWPRISTLLSMRIPARSGGPAWPRFTSLDEVIFH